MSTSLPLPKKIWNQTPPEAQALILALLERVAELEKQVTDLTARLNQNSTNSSKPPWSDEPSIPKKKPRNKSKRKRGGQPGHPRHERPLVPAEEVDETIECKPSECRRCGEDLTGEDEEPIRHHGAEIPPIRPVVTEYRLHSLECEGCGTTTRAEVPVGVPQGQFGPRLQALLAMLSGAYRLSKRQIQSIARDVFGLIISLGAICGLEKKTSRVLEKPVEEMIDEVKTGSVHADETGWKQGRKRASMWVVVSPVVTVFRIALSRGKKVIQGILGETFKHVIHCDRSKGYWWADHVQWCWAHLKRDFQAMVDRGGEAAEIGQKLLKGTDQVFALWNRVRDGTLSFEEFQSLIQKVRRKMLFVFWDGVAQTSCSKTRGTCKEILYHEECLWTFTEIKGIEPTHNEAERAVRPGVLYRKVSGGTDSEEGSRFVERMLSIVATCRQQGLNAHEYLTRAIEAYLNGEPIPSLVPDRSTSGQPELVASMKTRTREAI